MVDIVAANIYTNAVHYIKACVQDAAVMGAAMKITRAATSTAFGKEAGRRPAFASAAPKAILLHCLGNVSLATHHLHQAGQGAKVGRKQGRAIALTKLRRHLVHARRATVHLHIFGRRWTQMGYSADEVNSLIGDCGAGPPEVGGSSGVGGAAENAGGSNGVDGAR